ncbi:hypothetical protein L7F22_029372 [Adiantum nelumboides]|nr:hypothetical protein [Adiantum nelumboides]
MVGASKPVLLPLDADLTSYYTTFFVQDAKIKCDPETQKLLAGFDVILQQHLNECQDLPAFIQELRNILENISYAWTRPLLPTDFHQRINQEIDTVGWSCVANATSDLAQLWFQIFDGAGREHIIEVSMAIGYPTIPPDATADLPCAVELCWNEGATIRTLLDQYKDAILRYQDFWTVMEDLDKSFRIIEPEHPSRSNTFRRLALG